MGLAVRCVAEPVLVMQEVTLDNCPLERTLAADARDGRTYWIRRIPNTRQGGGDLCWMETNLAYAGGGDNRFGDVMPIGTTPGTLTAGTSAPGILIPGVTGVGQVCGGDNAAASFGRGCFWEPLGSNPTTYPQQPSTSTAGTGQFGLLYNWCAAMGGQTACEPGWVADPAVNICPAGWRLPTGQSTTGEFAILNNTINAGNLSSDIGLRINWLGQYGGNFLNGSFSNQSFVGGGFWSSSAGTSVTFMALWFAPSFLDPALSMGMGTGLAVRCVRE